MVSGILFYFGWSRAYYFYDYFGVDSSLLGLTTRDYLQLSVDGLFVPLTVAAAVGLGVLVGWPALDRARGSRVVRRFVRAVGVLMVVNGLSAVVVRTPLNRPLVVAPLCLAAGAVVVVLSVRAARAAVPVGVSVIAWSVLVILVGLGLFWAANDYSAAVGRSRARQLAAELGAYPNATVYSEKSLSLRHPGVRETRCSAKDAGYAFRYDGLKLILQSGDQYLFLPASWSPGSGFAVVLPRTDTTRLEFTRSGAPGAAPPAC
ncbi:hypothetical protein L083_1658 [Actinoplanes sp. N902-109]|nr:hypothetical protein L083_1658 [Actinoplanes sp. N902-109]